MKYTTLSWSVNVTLIVEHSNGGKRDKCILFLYILGVTDRYTVPENDPWGEDENE